MPSDCSLLTARFDVALKSNRRCSTCGNLTSSEKPMRAKTSLILVAGVVLGAALVTRRFLSLIGAISGRSLWGYGASLKRPQVAPENLLKRRTTAEEQS